MKKVALIFALFLLIKPIIPLAEYFAFYEYIKNELCVNKDKPVLKCNGKCYLKKQLAKAIDYETEDTSKNSISINYSIVFFQKINSTYFFNYYKELNPKINILYNNIYKYHYINSIFQPPIA